MGLLPTTGRIRGMIKVIRLTPYDTSTADGRTRERYRRAALTAISGALARAATIVAALVVVPLCVAYLGKERYGMWLTLSSLFSFAYVADLGITMGLQFALAGADAKDDREAARRYVSSAVSILLKTTLAGGVVLVILYFTVDWASVFNVSSDQAIAEAAGGAAAFGATWLLNVLAGVVLRVHYGYQNGLAIHLWQVAGSILSVAAVVAATRYGFGLAALVVAASGLPAIVVLLNGLYLFTWQQPWLRPSSRYVDRETSWKLLRDGGWYLLAGLGRSAVFMSGDMLVAQLMGAETVPEFGVPFRVAAVLTLFFSVTLNALMPAYAEATGRGDHSWVRRALNRSLTLATLIGVSGAIVYVAVGKQVIELWVGDAVRPSYLMLTGLGAWALISGLSSGLNSFVQGTGGLRPNGLQWLVAAVASVPVLAIAIHYLGVAGVPWGLFAIEVLCRLLPSVVYYRAWLADVSVRS